MTIPRQRDLWKEDVRVWFFIMLAVLVGALGALGIAWQVIRPWLERHL